MRRFFTLDRNGIPPFAFSALDIRASRRMLCEVLYLSSTHKEPVPLDCQDVENIHIPPGCFMKRFPRNRSRVSGRRTSTYKCEHNENEICRLGNRDSCRMVHSHRGHAGYQAMKIPEGCGCSQHPGNPAGRALYEVLDK